MMDFLHIPYVGLDIAGLLDDAENLVFFSLIFNFIREQISDLQNGILARMYTLIGSVVIVILTMWISIQGYRIVTGRSREPMMTLVANSARAVFICSMAIGVAGFWGSKVTELLVDDFPSVISAVVEGGPARNLKSIDQKIDLNLVIMQVALGSIDQMVVVGPEGNSAQATERDRAKTMLGIGIAGPAITGGSLLMLNRIAMALFIGFAPLFILCLLFDSTKQLFSKWLYYGIGTMFSLAVLSAMVTIAMKVVIAVAATFWIKPYMADIPVVGGFLAGTLKPVSSMALQQGGIGLILTVLLISAPPMAAAFFQGMLGQFSSYNQMANSGAGGGKPEQGSIGGSNPNNNSRADTGGLESNKNIALSRNNPESPNTFGSDAARSLNDSQRGLATR